MRGAKTVPFLLFVLLVVASLRPIPAVEAGTQALLAPIRLVSELAAPLHWSTSGNVQAKEEELRQREAREVSWRVALLRDQRLFALPGQAALSAGRTFVAAFVIGRAQKNLDRVMVRLQDTAGVQVGSPVCCGDVYVGRIASLEEGGEGLATVDLVTGRDFTVGATAPGESGPVSMVVGGLVLGPGRESTYGLAVHNPASWESRGGLVTVRETWSELDPLGSLADGFVLGDLAREASDESHTYHVRPRLDYESGLFQLFVIVPESVESRPPADPLELFDDGQWLQVRTLFSGDPNPAREGVKIGAGSLGGVRPGAALTLGTRLMGRVERVGPLSADALLLGDAGFSVPAVARIEDRERPHALGRIVSLGLDRSSGHVRFRWEALVPIPADEESTGVGPAALRAVLFTGSGLDGIPHGLLLGEAALPVGAGPHEFQLRQPYDPRDIRSFWVRRLAEAAP